MLLNCGVKEDSWESLGLQRDQTILKEINPEYSLEGLMLKLKLQYFGHLMQRTDSWEKILMLGKVESRRRRGQQRMNSWMASLTQWTGVWTNSGRSWMTGKPGVLQFMWLQRVRHNWATEWRWHQLKKGILKNCLMYKRIILEVLCEFQYNFDFYAKYYFASFYLSWMC